MENDFIRKLTYNVNNGGSLSIAQRGHDGGVLVTNDDCTLELYIPPQDMVMLINFYKYVKDNDIQHDFINYHGKNREV